MMTLEQIAKLVDGTILGDSSTKITGVETIEGARAGDLTFAVDKRSCKKLNSCQASAALVDDSTSGFGFDYDMPIITCSNVKQAFTKIANHIRPPVNRPAVGISEQAVISETASIGKNVNIYPGVFIGEGTSIGDNTTLYPGVCILENCQIGNDVTIFPRAVLYENSIVGDRTTIHANAVIGAFGFGYDSNENGHQRGVQLGNVEISEDVEIGAGTTIDRGTFGTTRIGIGSKLDNQVQIGHNCQIGEHNLLCSQVGIAGSSETGKFVVMGGQVGIGDHIVIADDVLLCAQSGVMSDLAKGTYFGSPCKPAREQFQTISLVGKLPEIRKQLKLQKEQIAELQSLNGQQPTDATIPIANENADQNNDRKAA